VNVQADLNSLTDTERQIQNKITESKITQTDRKRRIIYLEWQILNNLKERLRVHRQTDMEESQREKKYTKKNLKRSKMTQTDVEDIQREKRYT
jgi:hypothetical protein